MPRLSIPYPLSEAVTYMAIRLQLLLLLLANNPLCSMTSQCDVQVATEPRWPRIVYVPRNARVFIDCVMDNSNSFWAINLAGDNLDIFLQFSTNYGRENLNNHGVYELPPMETSGMPSALKLLINNTDINNSTMIQCFDGNKLHQTTLYLYSKSSASMMTAEDVGIEQSLNISWTDPDQNWLENISLTAVNTINQKWIFQLQNPYHIFTAPEGAPPCEIYSFKISHTYAGATYTGPGCSVSSPVLSTMLPSLPGIGRLQSSHNYSLEKVTGQVVLTVYFQSAISCDDYPVINYTLEITRIGVPSSRMKFTSVENFMKAGNLSDDAIYVYRLSASNSVGTVSTNYSQEIYTTDVQAITTTATEISNQIKLICDFIRGSDAEGCLVILQAINGLHNATVNLTRADNGSEAMVFYMLQYPLSCYDQVYAFDIEVDGSIGTVPLSRRIDDHLGQNHSVESCLQMNNVTSQPLRMTVVVVTVVILMLVAVIAVITVTIVLIVRVHPRFKGHSRSGRFSIRFSYYEDSDSAPSTLQSSRYSIPNKVKRGYKMPHQNARSHQASSEHMTATSEMVADDLMTRPAYKGNCYNVGTTTPEPQAPFPHFQSNTEEILDSLFICKPQTQLQLQDKSNEHNITTGKASTDSHSETSATVNSAYWDIDDSDANTNNDAPTNEVDYLTSYTSPLPHYASGNLYGGHNSDIAHDETSEYPRLISPFNFSQALHNMSCLPNSSSSFLHSSALSTDVKVVPSSTEKNIFEQHPQLDLAPPNPPLDPLPPQRNNYDAPPEANLTESDEFEDYKIPSGGTLV